MAYQKRFLVKRMPQITHDPVAWREHVLGDFPGIDGFVVERRQAVEERDVLERQMPELVPDFDILVRAMPGVDWAPGALSMYNLRPFFSGCSVAVSRREGGATLLRNYDLGPEEFSAVLRAETLPGGGWILGSAEAGWGYMDGLNDRGLAVAITFGGRFCQGGGFAVPVLVRYLLKTCSTVAEAVRALQRVPHRLAQNYALLDQSGEAAVVFTSPDRGAVLAPEGACVTNHQERIEHEEMGRFVRTAERLAFMQQAAGALTLPDLLRPPLYQTQYDKLFGTLYSVEFDATAREARYAWPGHEVCLHPGVEDQDFTITYRG